MALKKACYLVLLQAQMFSLCCDTDESLAAYEVLVGVLSARHHHELRQAIRDTWLGYLRDHPLFQHRCVRVCPSSNFISPPSPPVVFSHLGGQIGFNQKKKKNKACSGPSRHFYLYLTSGQHRPRLLPPSLVLSLSLSCPYLFFFVSSSFSDLSSDNV